MKPAPCLSWKRPRSIECFYWRSEGIPICKQLTVSLIKWSVLFGVPAALLAHFFDPFLSVVIGETFVFFVIAFASLIPLQLWLNFKIGTSFTLDDKGFKIQTSRPQRVLWRDVESYQINSYRHDDEMRSLQLQLKGRPSKVICEFDPQIVPESEMKAVIDRHLGNVA